MELNVAHQGAELSKRFLDLDISSRGHARIVYCPNSQNGISSRGVEVKNKGDNERESKLTAFD